jgi:hypothetical protein
VGVFLPYGGETPIKATPHKERLTAQLEGLCLSESSLKIPKINFREKSGGTKPEISQRYSFSERYGGAKPEISQRYSFSGEVWRDKAGNLTAVQLLGRYGGAKPEISQRYSFWGGMEGQSRKSRSGTAFRRGMEGRSRKSHSGTAFRERYGGTKPKSSQRYSFGGGMEGRSPSICAAGATPPPQTQQISGAFSAGKSGRSTMR